MASIWSDQTKYEIWLEVETLALEGMAAEGTVPKEAAVEVREKGAFKVERVLEIEEEVKHDVIAFLTNVAEHVGPLSRYVHHGMTSNDLLDTTFAVQLKRSGELLLDGVSQLAEAIKVRAEKFKFTPCIGRSHGIHAEPITFGLKMISWYAEIIRQRDRIAYALKEAAVGKIAGAVGTYASITPTVERFVTDKLGIGFETVPSQIVHRDRHAALFSALAQLGGTMERISVEIRHLQRTEVGEVAEPFGKGQKGSSAMPHKKNPILTENLTGLARLLRGYAVTAFENVPLWHERDISHSSAERVIAPDAFIAADFMLHRLRRVIEGMEVYPDKMQENVNLSKGMIFAGSLLLALVEKGVIREDAYRMVQTHALAAWEGGDPFRARVEGDPEIEKYLSKEEVGEAFNIDRHFRQVELIFDRAIKSGE